MTENRRRLFRRHLIRRAPVAGGKIEHVPAPIFKGFTVSNFGEIARAIAVDGCAAACCSICHVGKLSMSPELA